MNPICNAISVELTQPFHLKKEKLPEGIIANGQWIVADMDGTLIKAPSYKKEPTLDESSAKGAIFDWLRAGGCMLVTTSCETARTIERFAKYIPDDLVEALVQKRLLLATNGGAVVSYFDGIRWTEDKNFQDHAVQSPIVITNESSLLEGAVIVINSFYRDIRENETIIPENLRKKYSAIIEIAKNHPVDFELEELKTLNSDIVPRIEIRRASNHSVVQIAVIGIPAEINYNVSKLGLDAANQELCRVGLTHEVNVKGVDKALPIRWLQEERVEKMGYPKFDREKSVAVGDRPYHNDAPLTRSVGAFVSVCEYDTSHYIPTHVTLKIGGNEEGTKKLILELLRKAEEFHFTKRIEPIIVHALDETVDKIKKIN